MGVSRGSIGGFLEMRVVVGSVSSVEKIEVFGLVKGFVGGQGPLIPINGWVDVFEPGES